MNPAGFTIHSCIHAARVDAACVLHTHSRVGVAVSAQQCGVLPISQQYTRVLASLAYHGYEGVAFREDEQPRLQTDLGSSHYLLLRNHGLLTVGRSIADAFLSMHIFESVCRTQIDAQAGGELVMIDPKILQGMAQVMKTASQGANIAWPALLRKLERTDASLRS